MKTIFVSLVFTTFLFSAYSQENGTTSSLHSSAINAVVVEPLASDSVSSFVTEEATYPGGFNEMLKFINSNLIYPKSAQNNNIEGKVLVRFIVEKDGSLTNFKILKSIVECPECSEEVIRVLKLMPAWTPSKLNDSVVRSYFNIPVVFKLTGKNIKK